MRIILLSVGFIGAACVLLFGLGSALVPLMIAFAAAYILLPVIKFIESRGASRLFATVIVLLAFLIIAASVFSFVLPALYFQLSDLFNHLPDKIAILYKKLNLFLSRYDYTIDYSLDELLEKFNKLSSSSISSVMSNLGSIAKNSTFGILTVILGFLNILMIPVFFFYITLDFEKINKNLWSYIPERFQPPVRSFLQKFDTVLSGYLRGQLLVASILACLYALGLWIVGLNYGILIGLFAGFLCVIPYFGFAMGVLLSYGVVLTMESPMTVGIGVGIVFIVVQTFEGFLITPKLVGSKVGLSAFLTILSLIIGGNLAGLTGMILGIPMMALLKSYLPDLKSKLNRSINEHHSNVIT